MINKVMLSGRVTRDPELRQYKDGSGYIADFGFAFEPKKGETNFVEVKAFGSFAEKLVAQYIKKGQQLFIVGKLRLTTFQKLDGSKGYSTEIILEDVDFGQGGRRED